MKNFLAISCVLWCALALTAPKVPKVAPKNVVEKAVPAKAIPTTSTAQSVKVPPNPNGRKGGAEHQAKVEAVKEEVTERGLRPETEHMIETPEGAKSKRFIDVVGIDEKTEKVKEMHQVGVQTKKGQPVAREREALDDVQKATGQRPDFHPYNK